MSVVTLQLGQCGNQMGFHLFDSLAGSAGPAGAEGESAPKIPVKIRENFREEIVEKFFHERENSPLMARAVLIDMETKVIDGILEESRRRLSASNWRFDPSSRFSRKTGSGNNWANGFAHFGAACRDQIEELVRRETEICDRLDGFLLLMSLAGGTGSGLGAAVAATLRDSFSGGGGREKTSVCQAVWPHSAGEVLLQNYNTLLSVAHLHQSSDAVTLHFNDTLQHVCKNRLRLQRVDFSDMNGLIAHQLSSVLAPSWRLPDTDGRPTNRLTDLVSSLTPHPGHRLLRVFSVPIMSPDCLDFSRDRWSVLTRRLRRMLLADSAVDEGLDRGFEERAEIRSVANLLHLRGDGLDERLGGVGRGRGDSSEPPDLNSLRDSNIYASWTPAEDRLTAFASPMRHGGYEKSATLVSNSSGVWRPLDGLVEKAWRMFGVRAYLHQYEAFGFEREDFLDSFAAVEQIVGNYKSL